MPQRDIIQIDLIRLTTGERVLRLTDRVSGLALEKRVDPKQPVARQQQRLLEAFKEAIVKAELTAA